MSDTKQLPPGDENPMTPEQQAEMVRLIDAFAAANRHELSLLGTRFIRAQRMKFLPPSSMLTEAIAATDKALAELVSYSQKLNKELQPQ